MKYINHKNNIPTRYDVSIFWVCVIVVLVWINGCNDTSINAFQPPRILPVVPVVIKHQPLTKKYILTRSCRTIHHRRFSNQQQDESDPSMTKSKMESFIINNNNNNNDSTNIETFQKLSSQDTAAKTGTVNERLIAELQAATAMEKSNVGSSSSTSSSSSGRNGGQKSNNNTNKFITAASFFKSSKTDVERRAAIAEAQNLNGVNPITTFFGAIFALLCAYGLWYITQSLASYFTLHPSDSDIYFVERVTLLSRNIIMGLSALASGFFGVTGIGILLLAIRVGYGVVIGELDPTPIVSNPSRNKIATNDDNTKVDMSNVWDMMMNKSSKKGPR